MLKNLRRITVSLSEDTVKKLDKYAEQLGQVSRSDAARVLLIEALKEK
ncbi:ribbon-helix-helix protein, CopG family [Candidatus Bathyarchaeota archaeon]|nr:MAG: ribbon-helix-helix protein, CopG family [Candidatus Bathyarchaeota archaeon]